ncbi:MAG: sterol desaturase family protein [Candidatus Obscuribacterales bacterium]|nr:sterol desaturase family protein [Candidatus Obscuribacterales bacterium]
MSIALKTLAVLVAALTAGLLWFFPFTVGTILAGWVGGLLFEYFLHRLYHSHNIGTHKEHHTDYFFLEPLETAKRAHPLWEYTKYALIVLICLMPLAALIGWKYYFIFYAGMVFHLMVIYQAVHFLFHYDKHLPQSVTSSEWYIWWRLCHIEHHWHSSRKNYSVSCPFIDMLFGTYEKPRPSYRDVPMKRGGRKVEVVAETAEAAQTGEA